MGSYTAYARSPSPSPKNKLLCDLASQDGNISSPKGQRGTKGKGDIFEARFKLKSFPKRE